MVPFLVSFSSDASASLQRTDSLYRHVRDASQHRTSGGVWQKLSIQIGLQGTSDFRLLQRFRLQPILLQHLIRMNMPVDESGTVHFTTTLFALIRESLSIKMRPGEKRKKYIPI